VIHHVSIPAREPERVARVLAELLGGYAGPFIGPIPGAWVVYQEDGVGTGIEVYTEDTQLFPGEGQTLGAVRTARRSNASVRAKAGEPCTSGAGRPASASSSCTSSGSRTA
jgi:hypothetical protein